jgi:hypothetical protein
MVAGSHPSDIAADPFDHTGAFVAENHRKRRRHELVAHDHVGVAHPRAHDADQDFVGSRFIEKNALDDGRRAPLPLDSCEGFNAPLHLHRRQNSKPSRAYHSRGRL